MDIADHFLHNEVAGVADIADMFDVDADDVREWARDNNVPRLGYQFIFTKAKALEFQAELETDEDEPELDEDDSELDDEEDESVSYG